MLTQLGHLSKTPSVLLLQQLSYTQPSKTFFTIPVQSKSAIRHRDQHYNTLKQFVSSQGSERWFSKSAVFSL